MLIYSEMSPHRATNPLGLLTGRSECQITLLLGRRGKKDGIKRGKLERKGSVFQEVVKRRHLWRQISGGRLQVGVGGEVERQQGTGKKRRSEHKGKT